MERYLKSKLKDGKFQNLTKKRSKAMGAVKGKGNKSTEIKFKMALVRKGIDGWTTHPKDIEGKPDIFFPEQGLAIFLDGCFWHGCPKCGHIPKNNRPFWKAKIERNKERDEKKRRKLRNKGYSVIKFWEHQINKDLDKCIEKVMTKLNN